MAPWVLSLPTVVYVMRRRRLRQCIVLVSFACHDGCVDDLQRILGYTDAIDQSAPITKVADELFVMSCWTSQFCSALIRAAEAAGGFSAQPGDPVPGHEISLALISPRLFEAVQDDMGMRIWPQLQQHWPPQAETGNRSLPWLAMGLPIMHLHALRQTANNVIRPLMCMCKK